MMNDGFQSKSLFFFSNSDDDQPEDDMSLLFFPLFFPGFSHDFRAALGTRAPAKAPMMHHLHSLLVLENGDPRGRQIAMAHVEMANNG